MDAWIDEFLIDELLISGCLLLYKSIRASEVGGYICLIVQGY